MEDNINQFGKIKPRELVEEMETSYLDYAMSVIVARALPDVRDGLKPVHRRILFAMNELGLRSTSKHRKSATVVGEVLGKYHPHGDIAVYDSLVRMAQDFSMRYQLVDGQGNFGSIDGDSAAAMRYTEAKMKSLSEELLTDIDKNTVDFADNYDATRQEPKVLPAKVPQLLLNGTLGIAVGMATNIAPHNLKEVCSGVIATIENPDIEINELMTHITGPDFPTGAHAYSTNSVREAFLTGRGAVVMRAVAVIEETKKNTYRIVVTEIPYQVNKSDLITKIANLVKDKKIDGITDIRDESDRTEGVRIVIELRVNAYANKILNSLYELTQLQTSFHYNMVALVNGIQPRLLNLKDILVEFINHRKIVIRRRTEFDLKKAREREHILEGLKKALDNIDAVITCIRESETKEIAHTNLVEKFALTPIQAQAILEMRLSALAGLERKKVLDELEEIKKLIKFLENILANEPEILNIIKSEQLEMIEKYGDKRKTKIFSHDIGKFNTEDLVPNEQVIVTLTESGYIKRISSDTFKTQKRGGKGVMGMTVKDEDNIYQLVSTYSHNDILFFTDKGRVFLTKVYDLPQAQRQAKGQAIVNIIQLAPEEKITAMLSPDKRSKDKYFFMTTKKGAIKKTEISRYQNVRKSGIIAIGLKKDDVLKFVRTTSGEDNVLIATLNGQGIYLNEKQSRPMGRSASGVRGIKLRATDEVVSMDIVKENEVNTSDLLTVLENGFGKRTLISKHFHIQKRGGVGLRVSKINEKGGKIVKSLVINNEKGDIVIISKNGTTIRLTIKNIKRLGRDTMGVTLMRMKKDKVASVEYLVEDEIIVPETPSTPSLPSKPSSSEKIVKKEPKPAVPESKKTLEEPDDFVTKMI